MADAVSVHDNHRRDRHQGKGIGCPVPHLAVALLTAHGGGQGDAGDDLARAQHGFDMRRVARQQVEIGQRHLARRGAVDVHNGVKRAQSHGHVAGIGGDAMFRRPQDRMVARHPANGRTARAGVALVAGHAAVIEIGTARALHQVAAGGRHVAQLPAGPCQQGARQDRIIAPHRRMSG